MIEPPTQHVGGAAKTKPRKRPNYLEHEDHCRIIKRIARGETQAALAREFGVTRAAVSKLYKKRQHILGREEVDKPFATEEPQATRARDSSVETDAKLHPPTVASKSETARLLLTRLQDPRTSPAEFRRAAARLTFTLIEEVLGLYDVEHVERAATHSEFCAVTLGNESDSFLTAFGQIDPEAPTGQIRVQTQQDNGCMRWNLHYLDVPDSIVTRRVLLFSTSASGGVACKVIEALRRIGVLEHRIAVVMVVCSSQRYEEISKQYPRITIIVATVGDEWTGRLQFDNVGAGAVIPHSNLTSLEHF